jgi:2-polyprenyl-3-methyl-5-hydroxy-6-metoxy-1,4-benzoquinol methylase
MSKTDDYGWTADAPESSGYLNPAVIALARAAGARRVLDAGCGNGALAVDLARAGFDVIGVDGDAAGIEFARSRATELQFAVADFGKPAGDQGLLDRGAFDLVVSTEVVEHLYDPRELPRFCFEAVRPGGTLLISTPYHGYLKNLALSLADKWDDHHTANWHGGHIKFWSRATLATLLEGAGFVVTGFRGVGRLPWLWKSMILVARRPEAAT